MTSNATQYIETLPIDDKQKAVLYFYAQIIEDTVVVDSTDSVSIEKIGSDMLLLSGCSLEYYEDLTDFLTYTDVIRTTILDTDDKRERYATIENSDEVAMSSPPTDINCVDIVAKYSK